MMRLIKLAVVAIFVAFLLVFMSCAMQRTGSEALLGGAAATPTPAIKGSPTPAANAATPAPPSGAGSGKKITKAFVLNQESASKYGDVAFDHDTHAFQNYSPDGKSPIGCVECHHTDQPKAALKPPLVTSERDVTLTLESWRASNQKVNECRSCHFRRDDIPDDKEMPVIEVMERGKKVSKDLDNEYSYHQNCNVCHDKAAELRPALKNKPDFATGDNKDCNKCHKAN